MQNIGSTPEADLVMVREWDSDKFHSRVLELEASSYVARQESYHIVPEMNPETGEIMHLYTIEMVKAGRKDCNG